MAKVKSPKLLHLSLFTSFQICRPKTPSSMILSPLNPKTFDISFPATPLQPPTTPSTNIVPLDWGLPSSFACSQHYNTVDHVHHSPHSSHDCKKLKHKNAKYKSKDNNETGRLLPFLPINNSSQSHHHSLNKMAYDDDELFNNVGVKNQMKMRRFKRDESKNWKANEEKKKKKACTKVDESFVVVKKSDDPYEDFKSSISEMIVEKQIFEPKELEHLLMSFLSLNSRIHHKVIIEAFTQILKDVFC